MMRTLTYSVMMVVALVGLSRAQTTVSPKTILEIQPFYRTQGQPANLGNIFSDVSLGVLTSRGYTPERQLRDKDNPVTVEDANFYLFHSGGLLLFGSHGSGQGGIGVELVSSFAAGTNKKNALVLGGFFSADELAVGADSSGQWMIMFTPEYSNYKPGRRSVAIIANCYGSAGGSFNADHRLYGAGQITNQQHMMAFTAIMDYFNIEDNRLSTLKQATDYAAQTMQQLGVAYPWTASTPLEIRLFDCTQDFVIGDPMNASACDYNPAADITDFRVRAGVAAWTVRHEWETREYALEVRDSEDSPWTVAAVDAPSLGLHRVSLPGQSFAFVRLVEVETSGRRVPKAFERSAGRLVQRVAKPLQQMPGTSLLDRKSMEGVDRERVANRPATLSGVPTVVVYATGALTPAVLQHVKPYWESRGEVVEVVNVALAFPAGTELMGIKESISAHAAMGTKYFHVVGSWEDDYSSALWQSSEYWQSKYKAYREVGVIPTTSSDGPRGIPTFLLPDAELGPRNTAQTTPYVYTDQWYADTDDDGVPNVVVTRWPLSEPSEVVAAAARLPKAQVPQPSPPLSGRDVLLLTGDSGDDNDNLLYDMMDEIRALMLDLDPQTRVAELNYSSFFSDGARNQATANFLNSKSPGLVIGLATRSSEEHPCWFFPASLMSTPPEDWTMGMLQSNFIARMIFAGSCKSSNWISGAPYLPCHQFLANSGAGALAWVGPTTNTLQGANYTVARFFVEELMADPFRPMAESWLVAMQRAYAIASPPYLPTLASYAYLGDPLSPYRPQPDRVITARVRRLNHSEADMPDAFAVGCPMGDGDKIVVQSIEDESEHWPSFATDERTVSQPLAGHAFFYPSQSDVESDSATVDLGDICKTTFTIDSFAGSGIDDVEVWRHPSPFPPVLVGQTSINVRSPDMAAPYGAVNIVDFAAFSINFPVNPAAPDDNRDFNGDLKVNLIDFATFTGHMGHSAPAGEGYASLSTASSGASVAIRLTEEYPTATTHRLYMDVSLENASGVTTSIFSLAGDHPRLAFAEWIPAEAPERKVLFARSSRTGPECLFVGLAPTEALDNAPTRLGRLVFDVMGSEPFEVDDDDFRLMMGEVLFDVPKGSTQQVAQMSAAMNRVLDPRVERVYYNRLEQNFPNPFNPTTTLAFSLKNAADVSLTIYDVGGRKIRELVKERRDRGAYRVLWNGENDGGSTVASGVYFYKLVAGSFTDTKKMTILK